jgi:DNA-binding CsgD family transcriptional regulator
MSKMAELSMEIEELLAEGIAPKLIAVTLDIPVEMVYDTIEQLECLEIEKQYEFLSYADEVANDDAQYYGAQR